MATATSSSNFCGPLQAAEYWVTSQINKVLGKVATLQRLAALIEQAGDGVPLPNLSNLPALSSITPEQYEQLRASCPFLNLPSIASEGNAALDAFISQLLSAYEAISAYLDYHPWARLADLQNQVNPYLDVVATTIGTIGQVESCLSAICSDAQQIFSATQSVGNGQSLSGLTNSVQSQYSVLGSQFGQVLNQTQAQKSAQIAEAQATMKNLVTTY